MKKVIGGILITLSTLVLFTGCARTAIPNNIGGKFYMAGDDNCVRYRQLSDSRIMCINGDGQETGYRNAMSDQEMQYYMHKDAQNQAEWRDLNNQLNYNNQQMQNRNNYNMQQMMNRNNTYKFQYVNPYGY